MLRLVSFVCLLCSLVACDGVAVTTDAGMLASDAGAPDAGDDGGAPRDAGDLTGFRATYPLNARFPEGGTYDETRQTFYVGSLADGSISAIEAESGAERVLFTETAPGLWWTLGMDIDETTDRLYVCALEDLRETDADPPYDGYVWVFDLASGERVAVHDLGTVSPDATCTDVAVAADGTVYVCDRENPRIYELSPEGSLSLLVEDDQLGGTVVGQNALVVLPDQSALLSVVYLPSRLLYVSLPAGVVHEVDITGDFSDRLPALSGADGMAWDDGGVLVAFTSQLNRITPTVADWRSATATTVDVPAGMTDVVATPAGAYLLNGQAIDFAFGREPEPFALVRFEGSL